jgi:hypothetical protein
LQRWTSAGVEPVGDERLAVNYDTSASFWVVFNLGMSEEEHGAAIAWAEANLVPAPSACVLLILAGRFGRRCRHRYG